MELPSWLRIVLLLLSFVSFLPQLRLLYLRKDSSGISLFYVLFNLIVATELFTISFYCLVNYSTEEQLPQAFVRDPPDIGDFINLAQFSLVWVLWLVIFIACLTCRSNPDHGRRITVSAMYIFFLLMSVIPVFVDALTESGRDPYHKWGLALFGGVHVMFVNPVINILGFAALYAQARSILARPAGSGLGALSLGSLAAQAIVFALLAPSWLGRLYFPWDELEPEVGNSAAALKVWFELVGFVPFDHAVFAVAQLVLFWLAVLRGLHHGDNSGVLTGETEPLLGN
ncbi:hypothetical protein B0I37DRAFT_382728 [Chaetomium sp. MPI-CAGE-AT-0009]|nr:hypothetical protein B0I37DRAFT_382728 [Chaetomium sp. MPI-CAGE-AT-0009]